VAGLALPRVVVAHSARRGRPAAAARRPSPVPFRAAAALLRPGVRRGGCRRARCSRVGSLSHRDRGVSRTVRIGVRVGAESWPSARPCCSGPRATARAFFLVSVAAGVAGFLVKHGRGNPALLRDRPVGGPLVAAILTALPHGIGIGILAFAQFRALRPEERQAMPRWVAVNVGTIVMAVLVVRPLFSGARPARGTALPLSARRVRRRRVDGFARGQRRARHPYLHGVVHGRWVSTRGGRGAVQRPRRGIGRTRVRDVR